MEHLIEDAKAAAEYLADNRADLAATEFYTKGSIAVFTHANIKSIGEISTSILNSPSTLTFKEEYEGKEGGVWKRYDKNTVLLTLTPCTFKCVGHSEDKRKDWLAISDLSILNDPQNQQEFALEFEFEEKQGIIFSASMPWQLQEGRVKAYTISEKKTMEVSAATTKKTPPKSFEECVEKHAELKERIAKLDQRVWSDQGTNAKTVRDYESTLNEDSDKKEIKNYAKSLVTLEGRVASAEKDTSLPGILASLEEIRTLLDDQEKMKTVAAKSVASRRKQYEKLFNTEQNLVGKAKAVTDLLADVKTLIESAGTPKSRGGGGGKASASAVSNGRKELEIPEIDEGALTPYLIDHADGPDGYKAVVTSFRDDSTPFTIMVQALKNPKLTAMHQKWTEERQKVMAQCAKAARDPSEKVDVTLFVAYGNALRKLFQDNKATESAPSAGVGAKAGTTIAPKNKKITCSDCGHSRVSFNDTDLCRECWTDLKLEPVIEQLDERADYLSRQVKKEIIEREKRNKTIRKKNAQIRSRNADKDDEEEKEEEISEEGPGSLETLYDQYSDLNEKLVKAFTTFKVPNSSVAAWEKLQALMAKAEEMLPRKSPSVQEADDEELYNSSDVNDIVEYSDEEDDEDSSSSSSGKSKKKKKSDDEEEEEEEEESGDGSLAHDALKTLRIIPVHSIREGIINAYASDERHPWLREELKRLEDIKEIYGFTVQEIGPEEGDEGEPEEWHTHFLTRSEAAKQANEIRVPGKVKTKVFPKRIRPDEEEKEKEENTKKNKKDNDEDDE